ncbi:hypothetical protein HY492_00255 [Candidatus Woesearchaeota archaeon]|nr:hypothetical protein [Candidatus Woesearchaeota archaeon]
MTQPERKHCQLVLAKKPTYELVQREIEAKFGKAKLVHWMLQQGGDTEFGKRYDVSAEYIRPSAPKEPLFTGELGVTLEARVEHDSLVEPGTCIATKTGGVPFIWYFARSPGCKPKFPEWDKYMEALKPEELGESIRSKYEWEVETGAETRKLVLKQREKTETQRDGKTEFRALIDDELLRVMRGYWPLLKK